VVATAVPGGLFVPSFSCRGTELDRVRARRRVMPVSRRDTYATGDQAPSARGAPVRCSPQLIRRRFQGDVRAKIFKRVERVPDSQGYCAGTIGDPWQTGAGLPTTAPGAWHLVGATAAGVPLNVACARCAAPFGRLNEIQFGASEAMPFEPLRGRPCDSPAAVSGPPGGFQKADGLAEYAEASSRSLLIEPQMRTT